MPDILVPMLLLGLGAGVSFMPLFLIATAEVGPSESGLVSGLISTSQMIGGALGLALLAGLAAARTSGSLAAGEGQVVALNGGYQAAFVLAAFLALVTPVLAVTQLRPPQPADTSWEGSELPEVVSDEEGELVGASRKASLWTPAPTREHGPPDVAADR